MAEIIEPASEEDAPRLKFTLSDVRAMAQAGLLDDRVHYEVIEGEIVPMMAPNPPHTRMKRWLGEKLTVALAGQFWVDVESPFYLEEDGDYTIPDIQIYPRDFDVDEARGPDALLIVEIANSSVAQDRGRKARLYARHGVREYWVINAKTRVAHVFREPSEGRFGSEAVVGPEEELAPMLLAGVRLRLGEAG